MSSRKPSRGPGEFLRFMHLTMIYHCCRLAWVNSRMEKLYICCPSPPVVRLSPTPSRYTSTRTSHVPSSLVRFHLLFLIFKILTRVYSPVPVGSSVSRSSQVAQKLAHKLLYRNHNVIHSPSQVFLTDIDLS